MSHSRLRPTARSRALAEYQLGRKLGLDRAAAYWRAVWLLGWPHHRAEALHRFPRWAR